MAAKMRNMGEACTAANRFLVHESVAEEFTAKFAEAMKALKPARGTESDANVGPLIDGGARDDVHSLVTEAVESGAEVATGGDKVEGEGYFYQPTVLKVANDCPILGQEIFGPVAPVTTFSTEEEAIELANASEYGLASYPTPATSTACSGSLSRSSSAWWASTPVSSPTPQPPSAE